MVPFWLKVTVAPLPSDTGVMVPETLYVIVYAALFEALFFHPASVAIAYKVSLVETVTELPEAIGVPAVHDPDDPVGTPDVE